MQTLVLSYTQYK